MLALHPSPAEVNQGTLTPSSPRLPRHHPHLRSRRLRPPLRLLRRLALAAGGHRHQLTDQEGLRRSILDVFCSCPMVVLVASGSVATMGGALRDSKLHADSESWSALFRARVWAAGRPEEFCDRGAGYFCRIIKRFAGGLMRRFLSVLFLSATCIAETNSTPAILTNSEGGFIRGRP
jgi:hypothetical protein